MLRFLDIIIAYFDGLATLATGAVAIWVFFSQKKENKTQAATILLQEVRDAEGKIESISEIIFTESGGDLPQVLPVNSWRKYSHLFARDFDQDQLKAINDFYSKCEIIQEMVLKQNNFFWINAEERARVYQQTLARLIADGKGRADIDKFLQDFNSEGKNSYTPVKTINIIRHFIENFQKLTPTSIADKLKKLAK